MAQEIKKNKSALSKQVKRALNRRRSSSSSENNAKSVEKTSTSTKQIKKSEDQIGDYNLEVREEKIEVRANNVEIYEDHNVEFPPEDPSNYGEGSEQFYGKEYEGDVMVLLWDNIYCRLKIFNMALGSSHLATHLARKLMEGGFKPEALLRCTLTGQVARSQGKERQNRKVVQLNLAGRNAIVAVVYGNHHKNEAVANDAAGGLTLIPADETIVRYSNESLMMMCRSSTPDVKLHWKSPKGEIIEEHKGRIHIESTSDPVELKLFFAHISSADKGIWVCEDTAGGKTAKIFELKVFQRITFTENTTILTVKEGQNATILCEVKGEPQPNITWHFNGQPISVDVNSTKFRILGDGLLINTVQQNDTGEYTCRAYQVDRILSDVQERTVLMKIEHIPIWSHHNDGKEQYVYINGTITLRCEALAEPPANFTWYRNKKQIHNDKHFTLEHDNYISILHIKAGDQNVFSTYKCKVKNHLGSIERSYVVKQGVKPPTPHPITLRGLNSNTFDIELSVTRPDNTKPLMEVNGYRIEYMSELEFKKDTGRWLNAKRKDFNYESGATFLLNNLEANTTYLVRAASRNVAGLSDWTKVEKFRTQFIPQSASSSNNVATFTHILCFALVALILSHDLTFGLPTAIINLPSTKLYKFVTLNTGRL